MRTKGVVYDLKLAISQQNLYWNAAIYSTAAMTPHIKIPGHTNK